MHSGGTAHYKVECDALTDDDLDTLAYIVAEKVRSMMPDHSGSGILSVYGVPSGGTRFAKALEKYTDPCGTLKLIVDDVLTTGKSMEVAKAQGHGEHGVVIFARGICPDWVKPIFSMPWFVVRDDF